uniref:glycerol-3-phosphate dehydrogenase [NAD(+)], cytoplasmic-like isoform X1 n=2 Tax=Doryrhamphus excisus TaxID=161450 RepID=UPI0025AE2109|nr:glycerol-3-phosphate dehydrogenase [NAD(+)], cytoplasmic-like isoform X1 [Doryrhamphus excisus]
MFIVLYAIRSQIRSHRMWKCVVPDSLALRGRIRKLRYTEEMKYCYTTAHSLKSVTGDKMPGKKVCIVGSGNWGSSIAKIVGCNVRSSNRFDPVVNMWVYEEMVSGRKLTEIINTEHENLKYLPGHKLPRNVVAVPDITHAVKGAKLLVFVVPHQFIGSVCDQIKPHVADGAIGISLIKGIDEGPHGLKLISDIIREKLEIEVSVLMGANIASEVADGKFCETTIGSTNEANGLVFKELFQTPNFRITVVRESDTVELCGALKNIVAVGAGFCDGLGFGDNTKAAVIRLGLMEMVAFAKLFCQGQVDSSTFLESCGVADLVTTCYGGRNRKVAEAFVKTSKSITELEVEMLNGQKLQGPQTSAEVYKMLQKKDLVSKFPLFAAIYLICFEGKEVKEFITCLQNHPEHV